MMFDIKQIKFSADSSVDDILSCLKRYGCVIIENVLSKKDIEEIQFQIKPYLDSCDGDSQNSFNGEFTKRFGRLMYRIPKAREIVRNSIILNLLDQTLKTSAYEYKLTFDGIMHVMAGQEAQILHRDNTHFANTPSTPPVLLATLWAIEDFHQLNGGTVFVPGSHLWFDERQPTQDELACATMKAGSVLVYYGNLIHGAGRSVFGTRTGLSLQYSVSWLQQEENQALSVPIDVLSTFDEELLKLLGINRISRNCGTVDGKHPLNFVLNDEKHRSMSMTDSEYNNGQIHELDLKHSNVRDEKSTDVYYHQTLDNNFIDPASLDAIVERLKKAELITSAFSQVISCCNEDSTIEDPEPII